MKQQIDLTYTQDEEEYGDLLLGAVITKYNDNEIFITGYDILTGTHPFTQTSTTVIIRPEDATRLRDWLNNFLEDSK